MDYKQFEGHTPGPRQAARIAELEAEVERLRREPDNTREEADYWHALMMIGTELLRAADRDFEAEDAPNA